MARKRHKPEEVVTELWPVEVLHGLVRTMVDAIRQIGVTELTYYRWRREYGGMNVGQLKRLKELENECLRRIIPDFTLNKVILKEACWGNFRALPAVANALKGSVRRRAFRNAGPLRCWTNTGRRNAAYHAARQTRSRWWRT